MRTLTIGLVTLLFTGVAWADETAKRKPPVQITISTPRPQVAFRAPIPLTIVYTNTSKETVVLSANGSRNGQGYPGEWFEVTFGKKTKRYEMFAIDPVGLAIKLKPGERWTRKISALAAELSGSGVSIDGKLAGNGKRMPDPFGRPGQYTIKVGYKNTVQNQPKPEFTGQITSNVAKLKVVWY